MSDYSKMLRVLFGLIILSKTKLTDIFTKSIHCFIFDFQRFAVIFWFFENVIAIILYSLIGSIIMSADPIIWFL